MAQPLDNLDININVDVTGLPEMQVVQRRMQSLDRQINGSTASVRAATAAYSRNGTQLRRWAKGALQQAGYQVGDFAVQVANGTNGIQAFGQQGSQLLGIFGPVGALLGAAVAIFSAVAVAASRSGREVTNLSSALGELQEPLSAVGNSLRDFGALFGGVMPFVAQNIDTAIIAAGIFAAVVGVRMLRSMIASAGAGRIMAAALAQVRVAALASAMSAGGLSTAMVALRSVTLMTTAAVRVLGAVLMRLLPVAIILALAKAVEMFLQLRRGAGGTAAAFALLRDVAAEAFERIKMRAQRMYLSLSMGINQFKLNFINALIPVAEAFDRFASNLTERWNSMFPEEGLLAPLRINISEGFADSLQGASNEIQSSINEARATISDLDESLSGPNQSMEALREAFRNGARDVDIFGSAASDALGGEGGVASAAEEAAQRMKSLGDRIKSSMESGFMSIIDGTKSAKEAFKSMASSIISELFRVLVVQRAVSQITGFLGAKGGFLGQLFPMRAQGGSVSANQPYIVGEKGPEMLVPSTSGRVIPNNQLGGGGGQQVIVNQTINVSTGVQQTVRTEIKQLMPQIAESAKQAVVDAKRRGGSYGRAFA